jgi:hypothetical protein
LSKHNNPSISERARRIFNNQTNQEISNEVLDYITPTIEIRPRLNFFLQDQTSLTTKTIFTTATDKDTYVTNLTLGVIKDVTSTSAFSRLLATVGGVVQALARIPSQTLTPQSEIVSINFNYPLKLDRGTSIQITNSTDVANISCSATIAGYLEEVKNPSTT